AMGFYRSGGVLRNHWQRRFEVFRLFHQVIDVLQNLCAEISDGIIIATRVRQQPGVQTEQFEETSPEIQRYIARLADARDGLMRFDFLVDLPQVRGIVFFAFFSEPLQVAVPEPRRERYQEPLRLDAFPLKPPLVVYGLEQLASVDVLSCAQ